MIGFDFLNVAEGEGELITFDIDKKECKFLYRYGKVRNDEKDLDAICFQVYSPGSSYFKSFDTHLIDYEDGYKIVMINNNSYEEFMKKGIPENLIPKIAELLGKKIYSSSTVESYKSYVDENRVPNATKFWERLKNEFPEQVTKDNAGDFYVFSNTKKSDSDKEISEVDEISNE